MAEGGAAASSATSRRRLKSLRCSWPPRVCINDTLLNTPAKLVETWHLTALELGVCPGHTTTVLAAIFKGEISADIDKKYMEVASKNVAEHSNVVFDSGVLDFEFSIARTPGFGGNNLKNIGCMSGAGSIYTKITDLQLLHFNILQLYIPTTESIG